MLGLGAGFLIFLPLAVGIFAVAVLVMAFTGLNQRLHELIAQFRKLSPQQRRISFSLIAGLALFAFISVSVNKSTQIAVLQQQFLLPKDVDVCCTLLRRSSSAARPKIQAIARFNDDQFRLYARKIEEPNLWQPALLSYDGAPVASYSSAALQWSDGQRPAYAGDRRIRWGEVSGEQADKIRGGKFICFALLRHGGDPPSAFRSDPQANYSAHACSEFNRGEKPAAYIMGALDYDTKTLHMIIN